MQEVLVGKEVIEGYGLSPQQRRLCALQQAAGGASFGAQCVVHIEGHLDGDRLRHSVLRVVRRHSLLRTSLHRRAGVKVPVQVVADDAAPSWRSESLPGRTPQEREDAFEEIYRQEIARPFDLTLPSPLRLTLGEVSGESHLLLLGLPAVCADARTLQNLVREIGAAYAGGGGGEDETPYFQLSAWLGELLEDEEAEEGRDYWREVAAAPATAAASSLPLEVKPEGHAPFEPASLALRLDPEVASALGATARRMGATPSQFLLACWQTLLWRLTGQPEVVVGVVGSGRKYEELGDALGLFAKSLPCRGRFRKATPFAEVLRQTVARTQEADEWQEYFIWEHGGARDSEKDEEDFPAFAFECERLDEPVTSAGLRFSIRRLRACVDRFKVKLSCWQRGESLVTEIHYDTARLRADDAGRMAKGFHALLADAAARPETHTDRLEAVGASERRRLLAEFNDTEAAFPAHACLHELIEAQVERTPESTAAVFEDESLTYRQLNEKANRLAHHLRGLGVGPESRVGLYMERSLEMVVGLLGILKAGAAYLPLDTALPPERLAYMLGDAGACVVLTQGRLVPSLPEHGARVVRVDADWGAIEAARADNPQSGVLPESLVYVMYTSGSTGRPKGAMLPHRGIVNCIDWMQETYRLDGGDKFLLKGSLSFDASVWEVFWPLTVGAGVVVARPGGQNDGAYLVGAMREYGVTVAYFVPPMLQLFLGEQGIEELRSLRYVICGGESLLPETVNRFHAASAAALHHSYGPTETSIAASEWTCERGEEARRVAPIGRPLANTQLYILDEHLRPTPIGVAGELYIGGDCLGRGYLNRPALTAEKFIPNPYATRPGARLYRTGDLARHLADGRLEFLGRLDHQVKVRGIRIELGEIEAALSQHPGLGETVVVVREDAPGDKRLVAYVVARREAAPAAAELRDYLKGKLPEYMVPSAFVALDALPLMPNGKVNRHLLPAPETPGGADRNDTAPLLPTEEVVAGVWAEVLGVARVGAHDNFFELGGHSLLATQVVSRLRKIFQVEVSLRNLFAAPTVAGLAARLEEEKRAGAGVAAPPIVAASRGRALPLSFAQQRLWFIDQMEPGNAIYNVPAAVRLKGRLNVAALEQTLAEVVRRHEVLRTSFVMADGKLVQAISPRAETRLPLTDLRDLAETEREAEARRLAREEAQRPFDLSVGPMLRAGLLKLGDEEHVVLLTMHHVVSDGWSLGVLVREVAALYEAYSRGRMSPLAELPVQYADFAVWQREWLQGEVLEKQLSYWKRQLAGAPPLLELPADRPRPTVMTSRGGMHSVTMPAPLGRELKALSSREGATLFMTLLAAFAVLLRHLTGRDDILVGTDVANRNRAETEGLIGFFINQLVLRTDVGGDPSFRSLLERVRETTLEAYAHQDVPFEAVVEALNPERATHAPVFQVKLALQNTPGGDLSLPGLSLGMMQTGRPPAAKLDLTLLMSEEPDGLRCSFEYNADLFEAATVERMSRLFEVVLREVAKQPEARAGALREALAEADRREQGAEQKRREASQLKTLKGIKPKPVTVARQELVRSSRVRDDELLPLKIEPALEGVDLVGWSRANRGFVNDSLVKHGALLFRGFSVETAELFERFARTITAELFHDNGEHPRKSISGSVYTPVFYPPEQKILWHNENSFNHRWPTKIWFCCVRPAARGGETPVADSRRVFDAISPEVRRRFVERGVMYVRNYGAGFGLPWQEIFRTGSRAEVEKFCRANFIGCEWKGGDRLRTVAVRPAVVKHPATGEMTWFNQAQHWHVSCLEPQTRHSLLSIFEEEDLPRNVYYGDGSPIEDSVMEEILAVYRRLEVSFPWRKGDVMVLDNLLTAHARNPFEGERRLLVAMGDMLSYAEVGGDGAAPHAATNKS